MAAVFAQSVKRVTAEREVAGSIPVAGPILPHMYCKRLDIRVARMTT